MLNCNVVSGSEEVVDANVNGSTLVGRAVPLELHHLGMATLKLVFLVEDKSLDSVLLLLIRCDFSSQLSQS